MISFNITGDGTGPSALFIAPASALPTITAPVMIDGYTQPGAAPNTLPSGTNAVIRIELRGTAIPGTGFTDGLQVNGGGTTIRGLAIGGFRSAGIFLGGATGGNIVEGNFVGTDASGSIAVPNGLLTSPGNASGAGITSRSPNNVIGGTNPGARNLISGNLSQGVRVDSQNGAAANGAGTMIVNNLIGTTTTGLAALPNGLAPSNGIGVNVLVPNVTIGVPGSGNIISGNNGTGINSSASTFGAVPQVLTVTQ